MLNFELRGSDISITQYIVLRCVLEQSMTFHGLRIVL